MAHCSVVSYSSQTDSRCLSCASTFTLINGSCVCAFGSTFNSSNALCICLGDNSTGVCNKIANCTAITYLNWYTAECLTCANNLTLVNGACLPNISALNPTAPGNGSASLSDSGLSNFSISIILAIIGVLMLVLCGLIIYLCANTQGKQL